MQVLVRGIERGNKKLFVHSDKNIPPKLKPLGSTFAIGMGMGMHPDLVPHSSLCRDGHAAQHTGLIKGESSPIVFYS